MQIAQVTRWRQGLTLAVALAAPGVAAASEPRLVPVPPDDVAAAPEWLHVSATHRSRFERLDGQFRVAEAGDDLALAWRTTLLGELRLAHLRLGAELVDSRMYLAEGRAPVDTTHVNPVELLQAYLGADLEDVIADGGVARIRAGRLTLDVGSRRLVARNRFRNTINAFTGLDLSWANAGSDTVRGFVTSPVGRRPSARDDLADHVVELDRERTNAVFWGVFLSAHAWTDPIRGELYLLGLHETDADDDPTRDRALLTPGLRVLHEPGRGELDFETELVLQTGSSRASSQPEDTTDLTHLAYFGHVSAGYTADHSWQPRIVLQYDHASGDRDPDDHRNDRFDTLFGARRFELGPTGIYGALARSNLRSAGVRAEVRPHRSVDAFVGYRPAWVAQARDAWTTSGVRDRAGGSGTFIGHQLEARLRWRVAADRVLLETGFAHLWLGALPTRAPNADRVAANPSYAYAQLALTL